MKNDLFANGVIVFNFSLLNLTKHVRLNYCNEKMHNYTPDGGVLLRARGRIYDYLSARL
jgi:hypothetical protein